MNLPGEIVFIDVQTVGYATSTVCINCYYVDFHSMLAIFVDAISFVRVPGNSAAVTALQEELNNRGIENVCLEDEVRGYLCL